ncbi:MAG: DoxX family membrane protein [Saprospiraceae bacterium]|nr:DoxX family membrane protein [Saprospiraceae bacterium]
MTIFTLSLYIAIAAVLFCVISGVTGVKVRNWVITFLQYFTGALFVFSGAVKAVDPLGTAYKMEQYFAEFETTFAGTWFSFIAPIFPKLSNVSSTVSVVMIVFEIVLGIMLLIGAYRKLTAWAFLLLLVFFAFLTGFTYLTGYVPEKG